VPLPLCAFKNEEPRTRWRMEGGLRVVAGCFCHSHSPQPAARSPVKKHRVAGGGGPCSLRLVSPNGIAPAVLRSGPKPTSMGAPRAAALRSSSLIWHKRTVPFRLASSNAHSMWPSEVLCTALGMAPSDMPSMPMMHDEGELHPKGEFVGSRYSYNSSHTHNHIYRIAYLSRSQP
jgi:hypothetical protein